jgi:urate oxidase
MNKTNAQLITQRYGKANVRVLKVAREGGRDSLKELEISVLLQGEFQDSYIRADNRLVVPADTLKNTVYVLAQENLGTENEDFALALGEHFLKTYHQVERVEIELSERRWERLAVGGTPHEHAFERQGEARPTVNATCSKAGTTVQSGIEDLVLLKSSGAGFAGFVKDEYTTLTETTERIFSTRLKAAWVYQSKPARYSATNTAILQAALAVFATEYSPSTQQTLFKMGEAALAAAPEISQIRLSMPNRHYALANLAAFDRENPNEIYVGEEGPHSQIEGTVARR